MKTLSPGFLLRTGDKVAITVTVQYDQSPNDDAVDIRFDTTSGECFHTAVGIDQVKFISRAWQAGDKVTHRGIPAVVLWTHGDMAWVRNRLGAHDTVALNDLEVTQGAVE